jgi:hydrogenase expression/formation protein HypC
MCIGTPGKIIEINQEENWALVETMGVGNKVSIALVCEEIVPGDYLMVHAGHAIGRIDPEDAQAAMELWEEILNVG